MGVPKMHCHLCVCFFANNEHLWLYINTIICKLITLLKLLRVNFSPVACVLPTFGRININKRKVSCCVLFASAGLRGASQEENRRPQSCDGLEENSGRSLP